MGRLNPLINRVEILENQIIAIIKLAGAVTIQIVDRGLCRKNVTSNLTYNTDGSGSNDSGCYIVFSGTYGQRFYLQKVHHVSLSVNIDISIDTEDFCLCVFIDLKHTNIGCGASQP